MLKSIDSIAVSLAQMATLKSSSSSVVCNMPPFPLRFLSIMAGICEGGLGLAGAWQALLVKETMSTAVVSGGNSAVNLKIETERAAISFVEPKSDLTSWIRRGVASRISAGSYLQTVMHDPKAPCLHR